jgi:chitodextrinase
MAYQAKWYTQGDAPSPDRPWETPWQPVSVDLAGSLKDLGASLPDWSGAIAYEAGSQIRYQGVAYEATRWNQADAPGSKNLTAGLPTWLPLDASGDASGEAAGDASGEAAGDAAGTSNTTVPMS